MSSPLNSPKSPPTSTKKMLVMEEIRISLGNSYSFEEEKLSHPMFESHDKVTIKV